MDGQPDQPQSVTLFPSLLSLPLVRHRYILWCSYLQWSVEYRKVLELRRELASFASRFLILTKRRKIQKYYNAIVCVSGAPSLGILSASQKENSRIRGRAGACNENDYVHETFLIGRLGWFALERRCTRGGWELLFLFLIQVSRAIQCNLKNGKFKTVKRKLILFHVMHN